MTYPGGKGAAGVTQRLINEVPPHDVWCEPFAGGCAVARMLRPARATVLVDVDREALERHAPEHAQAIVGCGVQFLESLGAACLRRSQWAIYVDPPYPREVCSSRSRYKRTLSRREHIQLLRVLRRAVDFGAMVLVSTYPNDIYNCLLGDWRVLTYPGVTRGGPRNEQLFLSYPSPSALHDYSQLGANFREREKIRRRKKRWKRRLRSMPSLERRAVFETLREVVE